MSPARSRTTAFAGLALLAGALLLAWSQPWTAAVVDGEPLLVGGDRAAGALSALALAALALIAALALAGPVLRAALGVLAALLGGAALAVSILGLADPMRALAPIVAEQTGLSGESALAELVAAVEPTAWPAVAIAASALLVLLGFWIAATAPRWPTGGRRYSRSRFEGGESAVDDWDALSAGEDPTGGVASGGDAAGR